MNRVFPAEMVTVGYNVSASGTPYILAKLGSKRLRAPRDYGRSVEDDMLDTGRKLYEENVGDGATLVAARCSDAKVSIVLIPIRDNCINTKER